MGLAGHYDNFKDFKRDVLKPAIQEVKKKTGMEIGFNLVRKNRKAQGLRFFLWHDDESTKYAEPTENADEELPFLWDEESDSPEKATGDDDIFEDIYHLIF